jgi:hypothetical protein
MKAPKAKRKGNNSRINYPGKLRLRRKPRPHEEEAFGPARPFIAWELGDPLLNKDYYDEGLRLIARHLHIRNPPGAEEFWRELALKLLQAHVPYFMPPGRRGPPAKIRAYLPEVAIMIEHLGWRKESAFKEAAARLGLSADGPDTIRRAYRKWRQDGGRTPPLLDRNVLIAQIRGLTVPPARDRDALLSELHCQFGQDPAGKILRK